MSLIIDIFVAVLLISAIGYGMILNRRIVALRRDQADLERLAVSFHEATSRAENSVGNLKKAAQSSSKILNEGIDEAVRIREDLNFLIERGEKLGDQLETSVRGAEKTATDTGVSSKSVRQLRVPMNAVANPVEPANEIVSSDFVQQRQIPKLQVPRKTNNQNNADFSAEMIGNEIVNSEAERELLKALQAVR